MKKKDYDKTITTLLIAQWIFMLAGIFGFWKSEKTLEYIVSGLMIYGSMNFYGLSIHYKKQLVKHLKKTFGVHEDVWKNMGRKARRKFVRDIETGKIEIKGD